MQACMTGAGFTQLDQGCEKADLDSDTDVDTTDLGIFQACVAGPHIPPPPACP